MKLSINSWHYKIYYFIFTGVPLLDEGTLLDEYPRTLCSYFWSYIGVIAQFIIHWVVLVPVVLFAAAAVLTVGSPIFLIMFIQHKSKRFKSRTNIIGEIIKARKDKVCPIINWQAETKEQP